MTTAQVVETSVTVNNNSPIQDYVHPDDQTQPFEMTPGFKPFTNKIWFELSRVNLYRNDVRGKKHYFELAGGSSYRGNNYSKYLKKIQGKSISVRVSARFELARVRVIGSRLYFICITRLADQCIPIMVIMGILLI